jgi:hypothetical protein
MVIFRLFREEVLHHSVRDIKRLILFAEDADVCPTTNKNQHVQPVATQLLGSENV